MNNTKTARMSALAFAAVLTVSTLTLMMGQEASADRRIVGADQSNNAARQGNALVNAQVGVNANVQVGQVCVQAITGTAQCD